MTLVAAGLDVARLNFSHGTAAEHARRCSAIREAARALGRQVAVMQDLQGPKIRVGTLVGGGPVELETGRELVIAPSMTAPGTAERVGCTYAQLAHDVRAGDRILLDDGRIRLSVLSATDGEVRTTIEDGGPLGEHKGINLPGVAVSAPAVTEKDRADMAFGLEELGVDFVALSFVRSADEVRAARDFMHGLGRHVPLVVKLEKGEAIDNLEAVMGEADAVMVARGDLGVELAPEQVPMLQKRIIHAGEPSRHPGHHRHADAGIDDLRRVADACRGERRGQRGLGWQRRGDALGRDGGRPLSAADAADDGPHRARRGGEEVHAAVWPLVASDAAPRRPPRRSPTPRACSPRTWTRPPSSASPARG